MQEDCIAGYKKIVLTEAQSLWRLTFKPESTTIEDVYLLIFDPRFIDYGKVRLGYHL